MPNTRIARGIQGLYFYLPLERRRQDCTIDRSKQIIKLWIEIGCLGGSERVADWFRGNESVGYSFFGPLWAPRTDARLTRGELELQHTQQEGGLVQQGRYIEGGTMSLSPVVRVVQSESEWHGGAHGDLVPLGATRTLPEWGQADDGGTHDEGGVVIDVQYRHLWGGVVRSDGEGARVIAQFRITLNHVGDRGWIGRDFNSVLRNLEQRQEQEGCTKWVVIAQLSAVGLRRKVCNSSTHGGKVGGKGMKWSTSEMEGLGVAVVKLSSEQECGGGWIVLA